MKPIRIKDFLIGENEPLAIICGPCVIESENQCLDIASQLKQLFAKRRLNLIFKASYDKANRSSGNSFRGPGLKEGLRILNRIKTEIGLPVTTDVHSPEEAKTAGAICDMLQIPAFLCRQTDLILTAGQTQAAISVKKGQFMAPWDMGNVVDKIRSTGNDRILLIDRGTTFGYNNLVSDFRAIPVMQSFGVPVCYDATHSVQLPGRLGTSSGGQREFVPMLSKAAVAAGVNCLFFEAHHNPIESKSDADVVLPLSQLPQLLLHLERIYDVVHQKP